MRQSIRESILSTYKQLILLRKSDKTLVYGDFKVLDDSKDKFVYSRTLDGTTYVVDCNLGKNPKNAYKLSADYKPVYLTKSSIASKMAPYEARIWKK